MNVTETKTNVDQHLLLQVLLNTDLSNNHENHYRHLEWAIRAWKTHNLSTFGA